MAQKRRNTNNLLIGGTAGFITGICGNLVAAWFQEDVLNNSFTPLRVGLVILCSLIGIIIMANSEKKQNMVVIREKASSEMTRNFYSKIKLAWSKFRTKGQGIHIENISAIGSDIDIDTK